MIKQNVQGILSELPEWVELEVACKTRSPEEILKAVDAGVKIIGENYVQEAEAAFKIVGNKARWHFIGHLQKNKVKKAIKIFDVIETVDSLELAQEIDKACSKEDKVISVLVEVNSGKEQQKFGVLPEAVEGFIEEISRLNHIKVMGLMTMGPMSGDPELARPYFIETKKIFERVKSLGVSHVEMRYLSMGMSGSYRVAIEEGANIIRLGTKVFGER